ncbi:hypothetical protein AGABI2DRAFT_138061, partial [Agaricus bisporus var. bisporus H97]|uniref:hypothetical protein n=1 Tax=Agaricus bisporus var. bisporus (strain H97 / ATCC MYA-4626 / FGSC 10389) TaxID=936046 RepID=UPI00029F71B6
MCPCLRINSKYDIEKEQTTYDVVGLGAIEMAGEVNWEGVENVDRSDDTVLALFGSGGEDIL